MWSGTRRRIASAALAASLLAADVVLIALILNPGIGLVSESLRLFGALFLPWCAALSLAYLVLLALLGGWPRSLGAARPVTERPNAAIEERLKGGHPRRGAGVSLKASRPSRPI